MLGGKRRNKQQAGETRESGGGIFNRLFKRGGERSTQPLERSGRQENYTKRGRSKRPVGLTPVVTPRAGDEAKDDDENNESSSDDHTTELEQEEKKSGEPQAHGQKHFSSEMLLGRYTFTRYLGHGSYGHVCEGVDVTTEKKVAIKKVDRVFENLIDAKRLLREMTILRLLRDHQSIVDMIDLVPPLNAYTFDHITFVFEFVDTDLSRLIASDQNFTTLHVQYMMYQVLLGMKYMHTAGIAHRDLKPANILVNEDCTLKICDFGLSRGIYENEEQQREAAEQNGDTNGTTSPNQNGSSSNPRRRGLAKKQRQKKKPKRELTKHVVTRWYRAPEVILLQQRRQLVTAVDMWSIGCIMAELMQMKRENGVGHRNRKPLFPGTSCFPLSARDPFAYADRMDQLNVIFDCIGTPSDEDINKLTDEKAKKYLRQLPRRDAMDLRTKFPGSDDEERDLLRSFITFDPEQRLTVEDALEHPYFTKVRDLNAERVHEAERFAFEDIPLSKEELKILIIREIGFFNEEWLNEDGQAAIERLEADVERKRRGGRR